MMIMNTELTYLWVRVVIGFSYIPWYKSKITLGVYSFIQNMLIS